tara:strand:- start:3947 stop:4120 length:174 start_codon:yes stop_codon:yes gene_type:complete
MISIWYWAIGLVVICSVWLIIEAYKAPLIDESTKKKKRSHGKLGGNLEDVHMRNNKN